MELLAWILFVIGLITGIIMVIAIGFYVFFTTAIYSKGLKKDKSIWGIIIFFWVGFLGIAFLVYYLLSSAYISLQAGNPSKTILLLSIEIIPLVILLLYFFIKISKVKAENKQKEDEENKRKAVIAKNVAMAKSAIQIVINEEKSGCIITIADDCEYKNVLIYVDNNGNNKFRKEVPLLDKQQTLPLDLDSLPDNQSYSAEIIGYDTHLLSFGFEKKNGNIESLKILT
jgi:hypothetical protein